MTFREMTPTQVKKPMLMKKPIVSQRTCGLLGAVFATRLRSPDMPENIPGISIQREKNE
jgi:hypothetical protein